MLREVEENEWLKVIERCSDRTVLHEPAFLKTLASISGEPFKYFVWDSKGEAIICFAAFVSGKSIIQPFYKLYHAFSVHDAYKNEDLTEEFKKLFFALKAKYKAIKWKVSTKFRYFKAFEAAGFKVIIRQTYLKDLSDLTYSRNINRILKRTEDCGYEIALAGKDSRALQDLITTNEIYWSKRKQAINKKFMMGLLNKGFGEIYELRKDEEYIASLYILNDEPAKEIFTLFLSRRVNDMQEAHTLLYNHVLQLFQGYGYKFCDLSGANMPAIAHYKAKFKGSLTDYCEVEIASGLINKCKSVIKKLYRFLKK